MISVWLGLTLSKLKPLTETSDRKTHHDWLHICDVTHLTSSRWCHWSTPDSLMSSACQQEVAQTDDLPVTLKNTDASVSKSQTRLTDTESPASTGAKIERVFILKWSVLHTSSKEFSMEEHYCHMWKHCVNLGSRRREEWLEHGGMTSGTFGGSDWTDGIVEGTQNFDWPSFFIFIVYCPVMSSEM